jgi:hypothetical protein
LDPLAEWVQTWEPEEINRMAIANQLYPGGVTSLESRLDRCRPSKNGCSFDRPSNLGDQSEAISPHIAGRPSLS